MATLTDTGGIAPEDTLNAEQSGETPPMPSVPDFARIVPITTIQQAKQQQMADEWGQQQQQKIASLWGAFAQDQLDQTVQRNTTVQWGEPQPTAYTPTVNAGDTQDSQQNPGTPPATPDVNPVTAEPAQNPLMQQFLDGLGGIVDRMKSSPLADPNASLVSKAMPNLQDVATPVGQSLDRLTGGKFGEATGQLGDVKIGDVARQLAPLTAEDVAPHGDGTDLVTQPTVGNVASTAASLVAPGPGHAPLGAEATAAGKAAAIESATPSMAASELDRTGTPQIGGAAQFDPSHPLYQPVVDNFGQAVATKAASVLNDAKQMARIVATKNPDRDLKTQAQQVAWAVNKAQGDAKLMSGLPPDTQQAVAQTLNLTPDIRQAVVRAAQREAGAGGTPVGTKGMTGQSYRPSQSYIDSLNPPEAPLPDVRTSFTPGETAASSAQTSGLQGKPVTAADVANIGPFGSATVQGAADTTGPSALLRHGLSIGGAIGGETVGLQTTDDQDAGYLRVLKALPYAAAGAALGSGVAHLGAGDAASVGGQVVRGSMLSPRIGVAKAGVDMESILNAGAIRGAQAAIAGDTAAQATRQAIATYYGEAKALPEAAQAFWNALKGTGRNIEGVAEQKPNDLGSIVSTAGLRPIEAITEATRVLLENGAKYADEAVHPQFGDAAARATATNSRLFMGQSEGWLGAGMMSILKNLQKIPGVGGAIAPFTTVPANLMDRMASALPGIGAVNMAGRVSPVEIALRQAKGLMAIGAIHNFFGNNIVGAGPSDQAERDAMPPGWKPWSVQIGGQWVSMHHLPPAMQGYLRAAASVGDMAKYGGKDGFGQALYDIGSTIKDVNIFPSLIQTTANMASGLGDPTAKMERTAANGVSSLATEFIPWYMKQAAQAERGTVAETSGKSALPPNPAAGDIVGQDVSAHVRAQLPGAPEQSVPASLTQSGKPLANPNPGPGSFANPFTPSQPQNDPVIGALAKLGLDPVTELRVPPIAQGNSKIALSGAQQRQFEIDRGQYLTQHMQDTDWKTTQQAQTAIGAANRFAEESLRRGNPNLKAEQGQNARTAKQETANERATINQETWAQLLKQSTGTPSAAPTPAANHQGIAPDQWQRMLSGRP